MKKIIVIVLIIGVLGYLSYAGIKQHFYNTVLKEGLIGTIKCGKSMDKNYDFYLFWLPGGHKQRSDFVFVKLKGRDWFFEGEIIKWKAPLNVAGLKTAQRPIKIYDNSGDSCSLETRYKSMAFNIVKRLPGVDTTFISIVKQRFVHKTEFGVYITNSGYLLRRSR